MNFIQTIIDWFKNRFSISVEKKTDQETSTDFDCIDSISVTAALSERLASLTLSDSDITIEGDSERAKYMGSFAGRFYKTTLNAIAQVCLGTGDCIAKPNTDGVRFGIDIVENEDFRVVSSIGDFINAALIRCDTLKKDNATYERWEYHKLNNADGKRFVTITQVCFKNGKEIPVSKVPGWASIKENQIIPNVDRLLFGRFKCPKLNRKDVNSPNGVPITFGADEIVIAAKESWRRFNKEFADKETMIFADKSLFKQRTIKRTDENGNIKTDKIAYLPQGKERIIQDVNGSTNLDGKPLIHEFSPAIRDVSLENEIERNFRMLEIFCGLSEGLLSKSSLTYTNVDEVRKSTQATFAFITNFRDVLEQGVNDLLYAIDIICNANEITPPGTWSAVYEWSDSYVESMTERFNQLLQSQAIGAIGTDELRAWVMNENIEQAKAWIEENSDAQIKLEEDITTTGNEPTSGEAVLQVQETAGKTLNGSQTQSLLSIMEQYSSGQLTLNQAINILMVSIGVTKEEANKIIQGLE